MHTVGADQKGHWGRRVFCAVVALFYGYANTLGVSAAESNFWNERRKTAERYKASPSSALPSESAASADLTREQNQLLAQLPAARQVDFRSMEPAAVSGGLSGAASAVVTKPSGDLGHVPSWISTLVLPYGTLRDLYIAPKAGAPLVVHIQDAHGILEAQKNMGALIQGLQQERGISLVGLEGASGAFALEAFRAWPDADVLKAVAETLLREDAIGGPEFAGLTAPTAPLLWGVEDKTRYEDNIQSFKDSLKNKPAAHAYLARLESASKDLKARVFSPALRDFDRHAAAYAEGRETLGVYVKFLLASGHGVKASTLNLRLLAEALHWEENLDFKKVERDRQRLVEVLARTLPEKRLNQLVQQSLLYRAGRMTYGEYYRFMRSLCAENGISLAQYGEINDYITYVLLAEKINRNDLLMELAGLETGVQDKLAATVPQKRLVAASRSIALLQKLTGHAMTPADWLAYEKGKWDVLNVSNELKVVSMDAAAAGSLPIPAKPADLAGLLAPFEGFCSYALSRNNALVENLLTKMTAEKRPAAVLVAGGFHTDGLTQILRRKDVSYVVVTPRIEDIPKDQNYLDVFARDPLPLEQLFTGERINLIDARPLAQVSESAKARATVAKAAALPASLDAADGELSVPTAQVEAYINGLPGIRNARVSQEKGGALGFAWEWVKGGAVRFFAGRQKGKTVGSSQIGDVEIGFSARPRSGAERLSAVLNGLADSVSPRAMPLLIAGGSLLVAATSGVMTGTVIFVALALAYAALDRAPPLAAAVAGAAPFLWPAGTREAYAWFMNSGWSVQGGKSVRTLSFLTSAIKNAEGQADRKDDPVRAIRTLIDVLEGNAFSPGAREIAESSDSPKLTEKVGQAEAFLAILVAQHLSASAEEAEARLAAKDFTGAARAAQAALDGEKGYFEGYRVEGKHGEAEDLDRVLLQARRGFLTELRERKGAPLDVDDVAAQSSFLGLSPAHVKTLRAGAAIQKAGTFVTLRRLESKLGDPTVDIFRRINKELRPLLQGFLSLEVEPQEEADQLEAEALAGVTRKTVAGLFAKNPYMSREEMISALIRETSSDEEKVFRQLKEIELSSPVDFRDFKAEVAPKPAALERQLTIGGYRFYAITSSADITGLDGWPDILELLEEFAQSPEHERYNQRRGGLGAIKRIKHRTESLQIYLQVLGGDVVVLRYGNKGNLSRPGTEGSLRPEIKKDLIAVSSRVRSLTDYGKLGKRIAPLMVAVKGAGMSILPSYRPNGFNFIRWAHFWEWVYQVPLLSLLVRPAIRLLQRRLLSGLKASPLMADQVTHGFLAKKDFSRFAGVTRLGVALNLAGSVALIGAFVSGAAWTLVPASLAWSAASAYVFAVAHVKKMPGQKVWAFAFGFVLAAVTTLPLAFYAAGGFPFRIPVLGDPHNVLQVVVVGLMANVVLHFLYNVPIRVAQWISRDKLVSDTRLGRAVLWMAGRSTMAVGDDGKKKIPLHRLPTGTIGTVAPDLSVAAVGAPYLYNEFYPAVRELARLTNQKPENLISAALSNALPEDDLQSAIAMYKKGVDQNVLGKAAKVKQISIGAFESALREEGDAEDSARSDDDLARVLVSQLAYSPVRAADMMLLLKTALTDRSSAGEPARRAVAAVAGQMFKGSPWSISSMADVKALLARVVKDRSEGILGEMVRARMAMPGGGALTSDADMMHLSRELLKNRIDLDIDSTERTAYKVSAAQAKGDRPEQQDRYVEFRYKIPGVGSGRFLAVADGTNGFQSAEWVTKNAQRLFENILQEERGFSPVVMERLAAELHEGAKGLTDVTTLSMAVLPDDKPQAFVLVLGDAPVRILGKGGELWESAEHHHALTNPQERERLLKIPGVSLAFVETDEKGKLLALHPIDPDDDIEVETAHLIYNGKPMFNVTAGFGQGADAPFMARTAQVFVVELDADSVVTVFSDGLEHDDVLGGLAAGKSVSDVIEDSLLDQSSNDNRTLIAARMLRGKGSRSPSMPDGGDGITRRTPVPGVTKDASSAAKPLLGAAPSQLSLDLNKNLLSVAPLSLLSIAVPQLRELRLEQVLVMGGLFVAVFFIIRELVRLWPRSRVRVPYMRIETLVMLDILGMSGHGAAVSTTMRLNREKGLTEDEHDPKHPIRKAVIARLNAQTDGALQEMAFLIDDQPDLRREILVAYLKSVGERELARRLDTAWRRALHKQVVVANLRMKPSFREERLTSGVYLSPMPLRTTHMAPVTERRFLLEFKDRLADERRQPGAGALPLSVSISDQHGSIDKFDALLLDAARRASPPGSMLPVKLDPNKSLADQGIHAVALLGKLQLQNQGDLMDRGPFGLKVTRRSRELVEMGGLSTFVMGNHDLWAMLGLMGFQYPFYEGYNFHGYRDEDGDVAEFVGQQRASDGELSSPSWWAPRMDGYVRHHRERQKTFWSRYEDLLNGRLDPATGKRARDDGLYRRAAARGMTPAEQKLWDALRGRNSAGQDIATGVRAVGMMSAQWWGMLAADLERAFDARRAAPGFHAASDDAQAWSQAVEAARAIADEVAREVRERVEKGEWWWRAFQAINHQNYTSLEWWAMDWVFHEGWGPSVLKELNGELGRPGRFTPANYIQSGELNRIGGFFRENFNLFETDLYQNTYMHALLPIDAETGEFFFTYKGREYRGKGGDSSASVWDGLRRMSKDVRNGENGLPEIYEALSLVNSWYADNTTVAKPNDVLAALDSPEKRARFLKANGINRLFMGHIPYKEFSAYKDRGVTQGFNWGDGIFFTDHGMGAKFEGRGGAVHVGPNGLALRGYEHGGSKEILENPRTVELAADGTEKVIFENTGIPREAFLERVAADVDRRLEELDKLVLSPASRHGLGGVIYPLKNFLLAKPRFYLARYPAIARFMETGYDLVAAPLLENGLVGGLIWVGSFATGIASPELRWVGWGSFLVLHLWNIMSKGDGSRAPPFWGWTLVPAFFISTISIFLNLSPFSFDGLLVHFAVNFLTLAHYKLARGVEGRILEESKAYSPRGFEALIRATGLRWLANRLKFGRRINLSKELRRVMGLDRRMDRLRFILEEDERKRARGEKVDDRNRLQEVEALLRDWPDILGDERNLFDKIVDRVTDGNSSIHTLSEQVEDDLLRRGGTGATSLSSTALYTALFTKLASNNGIKNVAAFPDHFKSFLNRVLVDADMDIRDSSVEGDAPSAYFGTDIVLKGLTPEQVKDRFDESIPKALKQFISKYEGDVRRYWEGMAAEEGKKRGMSGSARRKFVEKHVEEFHDTLSSYVFYSSHRGITLAKTDDPFVRERLASLEGPDSVGKLESWEAEFEKERGIDKARMEMFGAQRRVSRDRMRELAGKPGAALSEAREDYNSVSKELDDYLKVRRLKLARWGRVFIDGHWLVKDSKVARKMASRAAELLIVDAITELKARSVLLEQAFQQEGLEGDSPLMAVIREEALTGDASAVLHGQAIENVLKRLIAMSQDPASPQPELLTEFFERLEDGRTKRLPAYNSATGRLPRLLAATRKIFNPKRRDADKTYVEHMVSLEKGLRKNISSPEALRAFLDSYDNYRTAMDETHLKAYEDPREAGITKLEYGDELGEADANGTLTEYRQHLAYKKNEHEAALLRSRADAAKDERAQKMGAIAGLQGPEGFFILMRRYGDETLLANRASMDSGSKRPSRAPMSLKMVAVNSTRMVRAVLRSGGFLGIFSRAWRVIRRTSRLWAGVGFITAFAEVNGLNAYMAEFGTDERDSFRSGLMKSYIRHGEHFRNRDYNKFVGLVNKDLLKLTEDPESDPDNRQSRRIHMTVKYNDERMPVFIPTGADPDSNDGVRYIRNRLGQYFVQTERGRTWRPIRRESIPDVEPAKRVLSVGLVFHRSPVLPGWLLKMFHFLNDVNALQKDTFFFNKAIDSDAEEIEHIRLIKEEEKARAEAEKKSSSFPPPGGKVSMPSIPPTGPFTLTLPVWEWVFAGLSKLTGRDPARGVAYARSSDFSAGLAPWLELPLLPGASAVALLLLPSLPLSAAALIGAAVVAAAHGRQDRGQAAVRFAASFAISFVSLGLGSFFYAEGLPEQFIFKWGWTGLLSVALHALYNAAVPALYRLTLSAPAMPSPSNLSAYGNRDGFTLLRAAQARKQLTVELLSRVVDEIDGAGLLPDQTPALRARIKSQGLGAAEDVASACESIPSGTLSDEITRLLLVNAGFSVDVFNPSFYPEIEEALRVPEIGRAVSRLNVHVLTGSLPAVPGVGVWESAGILTSWDDSGVLNFYVHKSVLHSWRDQGNGRQDYLRNALIMAFFYKTAVARGVKANGLLPTLDLPALDELYKRKKQRGVNNITRELARRGRVLLSRAPKTAVHGHAAEIEHEMYMSHPQRSPSEQTQWAKTLQRALTAARQAYGSRTIAGVGRRLSLYEHGAAMAVRAAEWGAGEDAVLAMLYQPLYLRNPEEAGRVLRDRVFPTDPARAGRVLGFILRLENVLQLPYNPPADAAKAIQYHMGFLKAHLGKDAPEEVLRMMMVERSSGLLSAPTSEDQMALYRQILYIYTPLAERLGKDGWAAQMRDESFAVMEPRRYKGIQKWVVKNFGMTYDQAVEYMTQLREAYQSWLDRSGIPARVHSRVKGIYSLDIKEREIADFFGIFLVFDQGVEGRENDARQFLRSVGNNFKDKPVSKRYASYDAHRFMFLLNAKPETIDGMEDIELPLLPGGNPNISVETAMYRFHDFIVYKLGRAAHWMYNLRKEHAKFTPEARLAIQPQFDDPEDRLTGNLATDVREWIDSDPDVYVKVFSEENGTWSDVRAPQGAIAANLVAHRFINPQLLPVDRIWVQEPDGMGGFLDEREIPLTEAISTGAKVRFSWRDPAADYEPVAVEVEKASKRTGDLRTRLFLWNMTHNTGLLEEARRDVRRDLPMDSFPAVVARVSWKMGFQDVEELVSWLATRGLTERSELIRQIDQIVLRRLDLELMGKPTVQEGSLRQTVRIRSGFDRPGLRRDVKSALERADTQVVGEVKVEYFLTEVHYTADVILNQEPSSRIKSVSKAQQRRLAEAADKMREEVKAVTNDPLVNLSHRRPLRMIFRISTDKDLREKMEWALSGVGLEMKTLSIDSSREGEETVIRAEVEAPSGLVLDHERLTWMERTLAQRVGVGEDALRLTVEKGARAARPSSMPPSSGAMFSSGFLLIGGMALKDALPQASWLPAVAVFAGMGLLLGTGWLYRRFNSEGPGLLNVLWARWRARRAAATDDKSLFRREIGRMLQGLAPVSAQGLRLEGRLDSLVKAAKGKASLVSNGDLAHDPALVGKALYPLVEAAEGVDVDAVVSRLNALPEGGVRTVILAVEDRAVADQIRARLGGMPIVDVSRPARRQNEGDKQAYYYVDDVLERLPGDLSDALDASLMSGQAALPLIPLAAEQWNASDRYKAAVLILQAVGGKLLRVSMQAMEDIRKEMFALIQA